MPRTGPVLFPAVARQVEALGNRIRLARLRRRYSTTDVATRAGVTRTTLYRLERGDPGASLGTLASVLNVLGLNRDLDALAKDDALGRKLQDLELPVMRKGRGRKSTDAPAEPESPVSS